MTNATKYNEMGKEELRAACRVAGISYGKLNNDGMRAALEKQDADKRFTLGKAVVSAELNIAKSILKHDIAIREAETATVFDEIPTAFNPFAALCGAVKVPEFTGSVTRAVDGKQVAADAPVDGKQVAADAPVEKTEPRARTEKTPAPFVPPVDRKGYKIQKERECRNGVKRPSDGTVCGAVWAMFDMLNESETGFGASDLHELADNNSWNRTNVACEYYSWRKFMGIKGRQTK